MWSARPGCRAFDDTAIWQWRPRHFVAALVGCVALVPGHSAPDGGAATCEHADAELDGTVLLAGSALDALDCRMRCCGTQHCGGWVFEKRGIIAAPGACTLIYSGEARLTDVAVAGIFVAGLRDDQHSRDCCSTTAPWFARARASEAADRLAAKQAAGHERCVANTRWLQQPLLEMASCAFLRQGHDLLLEMPLDSVGLSRVRSIQANEKFADEICGFTGTCTGMKAGWGRTIFGAMWDVVEEGRRLTLAYPREKDPSVWAEHVDAYLRHVNGPIGSDVLERLPDKSLQDFVAIHETVKSLYQKGVEGRVDSSMLPDVSDAYEKFCDIANLMLEMSFSSINIIILFQEIWVKLERLAIFYEADSLELTTFGVLPPLPLQLANHELPTLCHSGLNGRVGEARRPLPSMVTKDGAAVAVLGAFVHDVMPELGGSGRHELLLHVFAEATLEEYRAQLRKRHWTWESGEAKSSPGNWMCLTRAESHWWRASCAFAMEGYDVQVEGFLFSMHSYSLRVKCPIPSRFVLAEEVTAALILRDDTGWTARLPFRLCRLRNRTLHNITVCTKPLFDAPDLLKEDAHLVQDWVSYHGLLGIDHFQIYDTDGSFRPALESYSPTSVTYVSSFPELISPNMKALANEGYHGCLVSQSYDHCFFSNAQTSTWLLHLHAPDSYIHTEDPNWRQHVGLNRWLQEEDEGNFQKQLCAVSLRSTWFGGLAHGPTKAPLFARYLFRDEPLFGWNRSELLMKTKYTLYLGGHKPYCRHRTLTFVAPTEHWRMNHYVNMDRSRCDNCTIADDGAMWAAEPVMRSRSSAAPPDVLLAATDFRDSSTSSPGTPLAQLAEQVRFATEPVGTAELAPVVKPVRARTGKHTARSITVGKAAAQSEPTTTGLSTRRVDSFLALDDCRTLRMAMLEGRWRLNGGIFEMALDDRSPRLHSSPEAKLAAQPFVSAANQLAKEVVGPAASLSLHVRALGLMHQTQVTLEPGGQGWRLLYFTHGLNTSGSADSFFAVGEESVMMSADGEHALTVLPQENVGYFVPASWSVTSHGPAEDARQQLSIVIIADVFLEEPVKDTQQTPGEPFAWEPSGRQPRFLAPAAFAAMSDAWLSHIHVFADVLPEESFKQLLQSVQAGPWTWEGKLGTTFRQAVDDTQSVHFDPDVSSALAPLLDASVALAEEKTGFPITYYHSYATFHQCGQSTPLHRDVGDGPRRLWTLIFYLDVPGSMQRELSFFTDELSHVGTFLPKPNSAILYPALLQHSDRSSASGGTMASSVSSRGSIAIEVRLAACSSKAHGVDRAGIEVELCYA